MEGIEEGLGLGGEVLRELEASMRSLDHELGYIISQDGKVRSATVGSERTVAMNWASMLPGEVSVHNHAQDDWSPPSPRDWLMLLDYPAAEMRVVSTDWTYSLKAPVGGWPLDYRFRRYWTGEKMRFGLNLKEMIQVVLPRIDEDLPHWYSAQRRREEGSEMMHRAWQFIAQEVGAEYGREPAWEKLLPENVK